MADDVITLFAQRLQDVFLQLVQEGEEKLHGFHLLLQTHGQTDRPRLVQLENTKDGLPW